VPRLAKFASVLPPGSTPADVVRAFIAAFIAAWPRRDAAGLGPFFTEDAVYQNMPLEPVSGREAIVAAFAEFMDMGGEVEVDIIHLVSDGAIVMTERVDYFRRPDATISLPLMGIIEVRDGSIAAWRDYFDLGHLTPPDP
jgi:limonene-1,2-epoxide hydrolase